MFLNLVGPATADTFYRNGVLVGRDVTIKLPAVTYETHDHSAMGTVTLPIPGRVNAMELTISKEGIDEGVAEMMPLETASYEARWAQMVTSSDGTTSLQGVKAFLRCAPKGIPGFDVEPGSASENETSLTVLRYQLIVAGVEYFLVDPLKDILRIKGKNYSGALASLL